MANDAKQEYSRRDFLAGGAVACATGVAATQSLAAETKPDAKADAKPEIPPEDYRIQNGRIRQSVMGWCFKMPTDKLIDACHRMGMLAMEGISAKFYPTLLKKKMVPSIVGSHGLHKGPLNADNHAMCIEKIRDGINKAAQFGSPGVIVFTGVREKGISDEQADRNCVECWKKVIPYAEEKKVNLVLEHLNSRDTSHRMKGHAGYYGDDVDHCIELIKKVDSPRMKLLFDIYHVQIMNGDVIRRIGQYKDYIGHYHTAGVPGRGELDDTQEINYPPIMRAIVATGYKGFVAHEFIPTWPDELSALRHAVRLCDV